MFEKVLIAILKLRIKSGLLLKTISLSNKFNQKVKQF